MGEAGGGGENVSFGYGNCCWGGEKARESAGDGIGGRSLLGKGGGGAAIFE